MGGLSVAVAVGGGCVGVGGDCGGGGGDGVADDAVSAGDAVDGFGAAFGFADGFGAALDGLTFAGAGGGGGGGADEGDASISSGVSLAFFLVVFFKLSAFHFLYQSVLHFLCLSLFRFLCLWVVLHFGLLCLILLTPLALPPYTFSCSRYVLGGCAFLCDCRSHYV